MSKKKKTPKKFYVNDFFCSLTWTLPKCHVFFGAKFYNVKKGEIIAARRQYAWLIFDPPRPPAPAPLLLPFFSHLISNPIMAKLGEADCAISINFIVKMSHDEKINSIFPFLWPAQIILSCRPLKNQNEKK